MRRYAAVIAMIALACSGPGSTQPNTDDADVTTWIPLTELAGRSYLGFAGGLYPGGSNVVPSAHAAEGLARTKRIRALDVDGNVSATGKFVLLSIGMSNTTQEFCSAAGNQPCDSWSFMAKAAADPAVNKTTLAIANGAMGGQTAQTWDSADDANYRTVRTKLMAQGLSEQQVQIAWVKVAQAQPRDSLPSSQSDAYQLVREEGAILRALKQRYPNIQQVFLSSRIYGGYATSALNPEPYAYQSGFAAKWTIEAQIREVGGDGADARAGSLDYGSVAPWVAWGPYLWANGATRRSDGLMWLPEDFVSSDHTHPSEQGRAKVADMLLAFFKASEFTKCWFLAGQKC